MKAKTTRKMKRAIRRLKRAKHDCQFCNKPHAVCVDGTLHAHLRPVKRGPKRKILCEGSNNVVAVWVT